MYMVKVHFHEFLLAFFLWNRVTASVGIIRRSGRSAGATPGSIRQVGHFMFKDFASSGPFPRGPPVQRLPIRFARLELGFTWESMRHVLHLQVARLNVHVVGHLIPSRQRVLMHVLIRRWWAMFRFVAITLRHMVSSGMFRLGLGHQSPCLDSIRPGSGRHRRE